MLLDELEQRCLQINDIFFFHETFKLAVLSDVGVKHLDFDSRFPILDLFLRKDEPDFFYALLERNLLL